MHDKTKLKLVTLGVLFVLLISLIPSLALAQEPAKLILATTTSTADSGLLDNIVPDFEQQYNANVEIIAVGTGQSLKLGEDCNADVVLVHARSLEDAFIEAGHGVNRKDVMYNDFIVVGPESDPAGVKGMTDAAAAFKQIADSGSTFISRGDNSGTYTKEMEIWQAAGIEPSGDWYVSAGQGMGAVLTMANEQMAYTLSDRGTYLARTLEGTDLVILVEGDSILFNPYGVIAVNPEQCPSVNYELAMDFINWLVSAETQQKIAEFKHPSGQPLFVPDSLEYKATHEVTVTSGDKTKTFTLADLQNFPKETLGDIEFIGHKKGPLGKNTWTGASLKDVMLDVDPTLSDPANEGKLIIVTASDGWVSKMRWNEVFGEPGGGQALADSYGCTECHGMNGEGTKKGQRETPPLAGKQSSFELYKAILRTPGAHSNLNPFTEEQLPDDELQAIVDWFNDMNAPSKGFMVDKAKQITLLAYEANGEPLTGEGGLIQLVMGMDKYTSRFAHWVKTVVVE